MIATVRVHVTATVGFEYEKRHIFAPCWERGYYSVQSSTARQMLEDAKFYAGKDGPEVDANLKRAYRIHAEKIRAANRLAEVQS